MDLALEQDDDGARRITNVRPLSHLGLDGVHGVLFFANDEFPNILSTIYRDTMKTVFRSVPFFLIGRDKSFEKNFRYTDSPETLKEIMTFMRSIQDGNEPDYDELETDYFIETLKLLKLFDTTRDSSNGGYEFCDPYFIQSYREFLIPFCRPLKKDNYDAETISSVQSFKFFQLASIATLVRIVEMINGLMDNMRNILTSGIAGRELRLGYLQIASEIVNDIQIYDSDHRSNTTRYIKPQFQYLSVVQLATDLTNLNYPILGVYGGITSHLKGRFRHASTAAIAVTVKRCLATLIDRIKLTSDLTDKNGNLVMQHLTGDVRKQEDLLKMALRYTAYQKYTDFHASIYGYTITERYRIKNAIDYIRDNRIVASSAILSSVNHALEGFCEVLQDANVEEMFKGGTTNI
jgi:hypothetical protein